MLISYVSLTLLFDSFISVESGQSQQ